MLRRLFPAVLLLASCGEQEQSIALSVGRYAVQVAGDAPTIRLLRDQEALLRITSDAFELGLVDELEDELSYDPYWLVHEDALFSPDPPPSLRWRRVTNATAETRDGTIVVTQSFGGTLAATLVIRAEAEGRFSAVWTPSSETPIAWMRLRPRASAEEAFYGLGGHLDDVNQRGKVKPMQLEPDLSIEGASNEQHVPVPFLIGTRGWGLFVESRRMGLFEVATTESDLIEVTYGTAQESASGLEFHLFGAEHPLDVTKHYYDATSPPSLPAEWAYGPLIWRDENDDQAEVEEDIRMIRALDLATSGIWIDRPYASAVNTFDFDPSMFPDPGRMIDLAHAAGLRMALWHTPYLEEATGELREEALERGFFPPRTGVRLNNWSEPIDFTNPEAYDWWQNLIRRYTSMGIEGFKLDYGEDLIGGIGGARTPWTFADGSDELTMHHRYTALYHQVYAETLPEDGGFLLCRTGRWGDQARASVIWPGDLDASFARHRERVVDDDGASYVAVGGLPASLIAGLTLGPSGFPFYGADTGGYRHSPPDEETFIRWVEQTALSTVMQVGDSSSQPPWVYTPENGRDDDTLALYRRYARLHLRLFPYVWTYAMQLAEDGRAIQRPLGLAHPEIGVHPNDTYLLGDHLLVAPVVRRGARSRDVLFPDGEWFDWWDGSVHSGAETVEAPLEKLPLFLRAGGIVPMLRDTIDTLAPAAMADVESYADDPGVLHLRIARGPATRFTLFDGTAIDVEESRIALSSGDTFTAGARLELVGFEASAVELDGRPHSAWSEEGALVSIDVPPGNHDVTVR